MPTTRTTSPLFSALTADEIANWLRIDVGQDDLTVQMLVSAATEIVEGIANQTLALATFHLTVGGPRCHVPLSQYPIGSIISVSYHDDTGDHTLDPANWTFCDGSTPLIVILDCPDCYSLTVILTAGYASLDLIPDNLRYAIALLVANGYDNRLDVPASTMTAVERLCAPQRRFSWL